MIVLPELSYTDVRELINITSLKDRQESLCERFFSNSYHFRN